MNRRTLHDVARSLDGQAPATILRWATERFAQRVAFATGFGAEGCVLIDIIARHRLPIEMFTLDTGLLFPATYALWKRLEAEYRVTIRGVHPAQTVAAQQASHGPNLWARAPDQCCQLRKLEPLRAELSGLDAWVTAIRRDQTSERSEAEVVEWDERFGLIKINPLVSWTEADVWTYLQSHRVPYNPLHDRGFPSIGCLPCTTPVGPGEDTRTGRWRGANKTECGLHSRSTGSSTSDSQGPVPLQVGPEGH